MRTRLIYAALASLTLALPSQVPFEPASAKTLGIPWQDVVSLPSIDTWALNPTGDAAIIRVARTDIETESITYDLHLLAINAQFTVPSALHGPADPQAVYAFVNDSTFLVLEPSPLLDRHWDLYIQTLNYTTLPPAYPPTATLARKVGQMKLPTAAEEIFWADQAQTLVVRSTGRTDTGSLKLLKLDLHAREGRHLVELASPLDRQGWIVEGVTCVSSRLAFTAYDPATRPTNSTRTVLYTLDLAARLEPRQLSSGSGGAVSSPAFGPNGSIAWLEQREDGNARAQRHLWLHNGSFSWEVDLDFDLSPSAVLFSKDINALNLLTLHNQEQSLFHLFTPEPSSTRITPIRIPSHGTIHESTHVGVTPLNHSHLVSVMSSSTSAKELWMVSHAPGTDPTDNYENIRLTYFSDALKQYTLSGGTQFTVINDQGSTIHGRVYVPSGQGPFPTVVYFHGDEEGGGWHDWWMPYWNPNAFLAQGYAVVTVNPTGAEGYSDAFTQSRRYQWGNQTVKDLKLGLDYCLEHAPIDASKLFGLGYGAYGGFVVHWLQGHNDEWGFRGLVAHDGIVSPRWWRFESAVPSKIEWEFGPLSYNESSPFTAWDPERFVDSWSTPELIIADGANDADVAPVSQSVAAFSILQARNVPCKLVQSASSVVWQREIFGFLNDLC